MDTLVSDNIVQFGSFRLDRRGARLLRRDVSGMTVPVPLGSRALALLRVLVDHAGEVVTRQTIMDAVWPEAAVEESNLTVQLSTLRRILDAGRADGSCIQTVPGRGYRFAEPVTVSEEPFGATADAKVGQSAGPNKTKVRSAGTWRAELDRLPRRWPVLAGLVVLLAVVAGFGWRHYSARQVRYAAPLPDLSIAASPPLSIVVLPLVNLSGNPAEDYLADAVTDDLTTELSQIRDAFVIARDSAYTYKGKAVDVKNVGDEIGVRYVLEGSVRKLGDMLHVDVQIISTGSGAHVWADHFDENVDDLNAGQEEIVRRAGHALGIEPVKVEAARSARERSKNAGSFDLILRARALHDQTFSKERAAADIDLYEEALRRDPASFEARVGLANILLDPFDNLDGSSSREDLERGAKLIAEAAAMEPDSEEVLRLRAFLLRTQQRWPEAIATSQRLIDRYPNDEFGYNTLAACDLATGAAAAAIPLLEKSIRLDPVSPFLDNRYARIGLANLLLGHDEEAVAWLQRALATNPDALQSAMAWRYRQLAAAHALSGDLDAARRDVAEANRYWPYATVRSAYPSDPNSPVLAAQIRRYQEGLRLAGLRDHADEDADFRLAPTDTLSNQNAGPTPATAPGAYTLRSTELVSLLARAKPIVIDTVQASWGQSIPGAIGLQGSGIGGSFSDTVQSRLDHAVRAVTHGDRSRPIVAVGYNSERFDGRNLALRLVALGYTNVYWYRGGREAWEAAELPETKIDMWNW